jgi:hypothetical protein
MSVEYGCHKIFHNTEKVTSADNIVKISAVESGSALVSMEIQIQLFISMWIQIRIQILGAKAKPMRIYADPDPGETLKSQNVQFFKKIYSQSHQIKTYLRRYDSLFESQETSFICKIFVNFDAPGSGSAFPIGSGSGTQDQE